MDIQTLGTIISFFAAFLAIWPIFFQKTLPEVLKSRRERPTERQIIGFLAFIISGIFCLVYLTSRTNLTWYSGMIIGLAASSLSLLLPKHIKVLYEFLIGPVGGLGGWFIGSSIHDLNLYLSIGIVLASAFGLITFFQLIGYYYQVTSKRSQSSRLTAGTFMLIEAFIIWGILSASSLKTSITWYHLLAIAILVCGISIVMPVHRLKIGREIIISFVGTFIGYIVTTAFFSHYIFYARVGVIFASALLLLIFLRLPPSMISEKRP